MLILWGAEKPSVAPTGRRQAVWIWMMQDPKIHHREIFSKKEKETLYEGTRAAVKGAKKALEGPTNISKEEHVIITCLPAFISEISSDSAAVCSWKSLSWVYSTLCRKWEVQSNQTQT